MQARVGDGQLSPGLGVLASCCVSVSSGAGASSLANTRDSHAIKTPSSSFAQGGPCLAGHLASISCRPTTLADNEQYVKENNFGGK